MRPLAASACGLLVYSSGTSVCGLTLLVYAAVLVYASGTRVCGLQLLVLLVYAAVRY